MILSSPLNLKTSYYSSGDHVFNGLYLLGYRKGWDFFPPWQSLGGLPVVCITFWFNAFLSIKEFALPSAFGERFSGLGVSLSLNYISPISAIIQCVRITEITDEHWNLILYL